MTCELSGQVRKKELRASMRTRRGSLTPGEKLRASRMLCARLVKHPCFIAAGRVGIYYPIDGEIDVTPVAERSENKRYFLPVLPPLGKRRLWFAMYEPGAKLIKDRFGIPEPAGTNRVRAEDLDLVLVPLVAFDQSGGRVGMGGGFYDSSLGFIRRSRSIGRTRVVGVAYQFQQVACINRDDWDVPLHGVVTDKEFIRAN